MHQKEERSVIRFLSSEGVKPIEIPATFIFPSIFSLKSLY
jgi:hypothetical protein